MCTNEVTPEFATRCPVPEADDPTPHFKQTPSDSAANIPQYDGIT